MSINDLDKLKVSTSNRADEVLVLDVKTAGTLVPFTLNESRLYRLRLRPSDNNYCYMFIYHANDDALIYSASSNAGINSSILAYLEAGNYRYSTSNNIASFVLVY